MRRNSESSWNQVSLDTRGDPTRGAAGGASRVRPSTRPVGTRLRQPWPGSDPPGGSGDVAQLLRLRECAELLQRLVLDLPDPLAGDAEDAADLVERPRLLAVQAVAQLQHAPLPLAQHPERTHERLVAERLVRDLVRQRRRLVVEEVAELRLLLVADRLFERDRS